MKPNFALSLSFEGIKLLHRAAGGWREVGEVSVTADDLGAELAMLRKTAASLEPGGVRTKLLIPPSQIKYLTIETADLSEAERRKAAEAALHDATPYELSELAYDISVDGPKTHVAAVARETLTEAEAFATEHRFHPVSFVAVPGDAPYLGEPFFGATKGAADLLEDDESVEPDGIAVVIVGSVAVEPTSTTPPNVEPEKAEEKAQQEVQQTRTAEAPAAAEKSAVAEPTPEVAEIDSPSGTSVQRLEGERAAQMPKPTAKTEPATPISAPLDETPAPAKALESPEPATVAESTPEAEGTRQPEKQTELAFEPKPSPKTDARTQTPAPSTPKAASEPVAPEKPADSNEETQASKDEAARQTTVDAKRAALLAAASATGATPVKGAEPHPLMAAAPASDPAAPPIGAAKTGFATRRATSTATSAAKPVGGAQRIAVQTPKPDSSSLTKPALTDAVVSSAATSAPATERSFSGFFSRRKARTGSAKPIPAPKAAVSSAATEAERMTVFGAREVEVGGKPRFLGLVMTVVLLVFLAGVAAWAAVFLDDGIASLIQREPSRTSASAPENQIDPEIIRTPDGIDPAQSDTSADVQIAALDPVLSAEQADTVEAAMDPRPEPSVPIITEAEAAARYAVTGIWPLAPTTSLSQPGTVDAPVYRSGIDANSSANDALALPIPQALDEGVELAAAISPPPFGQRTEIDSNGLIVPTPDGVVTPTGFTLFSASPPRKPPATLARFAAKPTSVAPQATSALAALRPQNRPLGLSERSERAQLGGVSRSELATFRPAVRPRSIQERAQEEEDAANQAAEQDEARAKAAAESAAAAAAAALLVPTTPTAAAPIVATRFATANSKRPDTRPRNFARIVKRAQRAAPQQETRVAAAASVAPRTVKPSLPSKASVARSATVKNAINLRKVNLIGIYGKPSSRRALVRLGNGRYQKVRVGDRIDGGRVGAIGDSELRYSKNGRNVVLKMP